MTTEQRDAIERLRKAAKHMDWMQVVLNGGPPCFHIEEDGRFCGRSQWWVGHEVKSGHPFVPLDEVFANIPIQETAP